jgi:hypothetical protein
VSLQTGIVTGSSSVFLPLVGLLDQARGAPGLVGAYENM